MTDVYGIKNSSVTDELYLTNLDGKRGRTTFKKEVNMYEREAPQFCFSEFPVRLFANWYAPFLPLFKDVVGKGKQTQLVVIYKNSIVASLDITYCSIIMSAKQDLVSQPNVEARTTRHKIKTTLW
jgi:hypothetical protein